MVVAAIVGHCRFIGSILKNGTKAGDRMAAAIAQAYDSEEDDNDESGFEVDIGEWRENQILIPDWTYFHCPGATLVMKPLNHVMHNPFIALVELCVLGG